MTNRIITDDIEAAKADATEKGLDVDDIEFVDIDRAIEILGEVVESNQERMRRLASHPTMPGQLDPGTLAALKVEMLVEKLFPTGTVDRLVFDLSFEEGTIKPFIDMVERQQTMASLGLAGQQVQDPSKLRVQGG